MTDGLYLRNSQFQTEIQDDVATPEPQIDLTTFSQWIELQPITTHAGLLELIGNDLYRRRRWPTIAAECKHVARDLRALAKYTSHESE